MKKKLLALAIVLAVIAAMIVPTAVFANTSGTSSVGGTLAITLVSIAVTPNPATAIVVAPGYANPTTEQFTATGTYSNGSTAIITSTVNWNSSNTGAATISSTGLATSVAAGQTNITASGSSVTSPAVALSVNAPPTSIDSAATLVTPTSATLNATVNPNGADTRYVFQWGTNAGTLSGSPTIDIGSGYSAVVVNLALTGLTPGTEYYYRISATNGLGEPSYIYFGSPVENFTTQTYNSVSISVPSSLNLPALVAGPNTADWGATNTSSVIVTAGTDGVTPNWMVTATGSKFMTSGGASLNEPLLISPDGSTWSCADGSSTGGTSPYTYTGTYTKSGTGTVASSAIDLHAEQSISASDGTAGSYTDTITFQISVAQ